MKWVYNAKESCGFKWNNIEELVSLTENLVKNPDRINELRKNTVLRSELYTKQAFEKSFKAILANNVLEKI